MTRKQLWLAVQFLFFTVAVVYFCLQVRNEWGDFIAIPDTIHPNWWKVLGSTGWVAASYVVLIETWRQIVVAWGGKLSWPAAARIWFISNLGRYVPGKIWQIGAMGALAQEAGVSSAAAVGSSLVVNLVNLLAGLLVVLVAGSRLVVGYGSALVIALVVFCVLVLGSPWLLPPLARLATRVTGRNIPIPAIPPLAIIFAVAGCSLAWNLYGLAFHDLTVAIFGGAAGRPTYYTAVFTLSYLAGYIVLFAPGGLGVRETSLVALLAAAGLETGAQAAALAIASRLWLTVAEAAPGLILLAVRRRPKSSLRNPLAEKNGS
ncbi:MAG: lysylphosphatidylglycerol synthase domain-containing protein [Gemmatimonadales bacterium]